MSYLPLICCHADTDTVYHNKENRDTNWHERERSQGFSTGFDQEQDLTFFIVQKQTKCPKNQTIWAEQYLPLLLSRDRYFWEKRKIR